MTYIGEYFKFKIFGVQKVKVENENRKIKKQSKW